VADALSSSSYAVIDSGYKYQFDKYNDVYRHVPLNGDIAGLCARTDNVADPWFSPGGFNRGQIKGAVKLAFNPNQTQSVTVTTSDADGDTVNLSLQNNPAFVTLNGNTISINPADADAGHPFEHTVRFHR